MSDEMVPGAETSAEEKSKRLTPKEYEEAKTLYELGEVTLAELAGRFGISVSALSQRFKRDKVERGSKRHLVAAKAAAAATAAAVEEVVSFGQKRKQRIEETREKVFKAHEMIGHAIMRELIEAARSGDPYHTRNANVKTLRQAAAVIELTRIGRTAILDMDLDIDEQMLPELVLRDLTPAEIETLKHRDEDEDDLDSILETLPLPSASEDDDIIEET